METPELLNGMEQFNKKDIQVIIAEDSMSASLQLNRPGESEAPYTYEEVMRELSFSGVKMGIDDSQIHHMVEDRIYNTAIVVAQGKPVEDGEDGYYEFEFDTDLKAKPTVREDGSIDYYDVKFYEKANEGDKLAQYYPPTRGVFGFDVRGKLLTPKPGKPKSALRGKGFTVSEDGNTYYATINGKIEYSNYDLKVVNVLDISGDVDLNIGNIDFNGDVNITGNVITGVTISAMGSIYIGGYVEGAVIRSEKDIVMNKGVNANGIGKIEAKGNVSARFFENALVYTDGDVNAGYILNSNILALGKVVVQGNRGMIHGGDVTGVLGIETSSVGNASYAPTNIHVGVTKKLRMDYANVIVQIKELDSQIEMYESALDKLNIIRDMHPDKFDRASYTKICQSKIVRSAEKAKSEEESRRLYNLIREAGKSVVKVNSKIYPGARVYIESKVYEPTDVLMHVLIRKFNDSIVVRDFDE
jgi:hypothetical protein